MRFVLFIIALVCLSFPAAALENAASSQANTAALPQSNNAAPPQSNNSALPQPNNIALAQSNSAALPQSNNIALPRGANPPPQPVDLETLRLAARDGNPRAQYDLGSLYDGSGVSNGMAWVEAAEWYRKAAHQDYPPAQYGLGELYNLGHGVQKDCAQAAKWYRMAAEHQNTEVAQFALGLQYVKGRGVVRNYKEAYFWLILASDDGDKTYTALRDEVRQHLAAADAEDARRRASLWKPKQWSNPPLTVPSQSSIDNLSGFWRRLFQP